MGLAIVTGIFTILGGLAGAALTAIQQRAAGRRADRAKAQDLFVQVTRAITTLETEKAVFRHRRDGWRPNLLATATAAMHIIAGHTEGNWLKGAAAGTDSLVAWDSAEGARFTDRYQAARGELTNALVQLSLMSPALQQAAGQVSDAIAATEQARKAREVKATGEQVRKAIAALRSAVTAHASRKWRQHERATPPVPAPEEKPAAIAAHVQGKTAT
jgi:hypothetical protein